MYGKIINMSKIVFFLIFILPLAITAQVSDLPRSELDLGDDDDFSSFEIMDSDLKDFNVFFVGENHLYRYINDSLNYKFVKYLHKKAGVKNIAIEFGFTRGYLINKYIIESDTLALRLLKQNSGPTFINLYEKFHDYNLTLPDSSKIRFVGIDVERFFELPVEYMCKLLPADTAIPHDIKMHLESLKGLASFLEKKQSGNVPLRALIKTYSSQETVKSFIENYDLTDSIYQIYLGDNYALFDKIVESLRGTIAWNDYNTRETTQGYVYREQCMEDNFLEYFLSHPGEKFYAQFGRCHVSVVNQEEACSWHDYNSIAARLDNIDNPALKGKVCSIAMFYTSNDKAESDENHQNLLNPFRQLSQKNGLTIFKLDKAGLYQELSEKYEYLIINDVKNNALKSFGADYSYVQLAGNVRANHYNYDKLNSFFGNSLSEKFQGTSIGFGIEFVNLTNNASYQRFSLGMHEQIGVGYNDTLSIDLFGYDLQFNFGGDLIKSKHIDFIPSVGYGFERLSMITAVKEGLNDPLAGMFGDSLVTKYGNPAVMFNAAMDFKINIRKVSVGGRAEYCLDASNRHWRKYGILVESSPKTSLSNYRVSVYIAAKL